MLTLYNNMVGIVCRAWLFWHVYCITVFIIDEHFQCNLNTTSRFPFPPFPTLLYPFLSFFLTAILGGGYVMLHLFHIVYIVFTVHCTFALASFVWVYSVVTPGCLYVYCAVVCLC